MENVPFTTTTVRVHVEGQVLSQCDMSANDMLAAAGQRTQLRRATTETRRPSQQQKRAGVNLSRQRSLSDLVHRFTSPFRMVNRPTEPTRYSTHTGDYRILKTLGRGATAQVFAAEYRPSQTLVAIKTVHLDKMDMAGDDGSRLDSLRKEIRIMSLSRHPHLLPVLQSFVSDIDLYIVTPLMSAGSCHDLLQRNKRQGLDEPLVACILKQVVLGLDYLHQNGLIHRDVKAANLLLDWETGTVKLADFGVSGFLFGDLERSTTDNPEASQSRDDLLSPEWAHQTHNGTRTCDALSGSMDGPENLPPLQRFNHSRRERCRYQAERRRWARHSFVGTPCWMAPEILLDSDYDTQVDQWSLGITALELACGQPPFCHLDPLTIFTIIIEDPPPTLDTAGCGYEGSDSFEDFIRLCLVKDPMDRITAPLALQHAFLRKACGPQLLARYLTRRPDLDLRPRINYLAHASPSPYHPPLYPSHNQPPSSRQSSHPSPLGLVDHHDSDQVASDTDTYSAHPSWDSLAVQQDWNFSTHANTSSSSLSGQTSLRIGTLSCSATSSPRDTGSPVTPDGAGHYPPSHARVPSKPDIWVTPERTPPMVMMTKIGHRMRYI